MPSLTLVIDGKPVGMERHRTDSKGGRYLPTKTRRYVEAVRVRALAEAAAAGIRVPLAPDVPVVVDVVAYCARPLRYRGPAHAHPRLPSSDPDADNIAKSVGDGLQQRPRKALGLLTDDRQIWDIRVRRLCCAVGEEPRTRVVVKW